MSRRVCLVGPAHPYRGGIAHFTSLLAAEFARDDETLVLSFRRLYPSIFFPGKTQYDESTNPVAHPAERWIDSINPITYLRAAGRIRRFRPDFVVFQWWHPFFAPAYATIARLSRARVVFLCHNVMPHESSPLDRILTRLAFSTTNRFLVQSVEDRDKLLSMKPRAHVVVQPHPIYDVFNRGAETRSSARAKLGVDGDVLLFFGLIRPYKGLGVLLDAFAEYRAARRATLLIVGEFYEDDAPYRERIARLGIADDVRLVARYVPDEEVELYFAASDVAVLPYLSATQSGIVQIAYGFDTPVIVTAVGGLPDVVTDGVTGYVVPPNDAPALAAAMRSFFEEGRRDEMAANVAGSRERFSWRACRDALVSVSGIDQKSRRTKDL